MREDIVAPLDAGVGESLVVPDGEIRIHAVQFVCVCVGHTGRFVDVVPHVVKITLPRSNLDHFAKNKHSGVAVCPARTGLETNLLFILAGEIHHIVYRSQLFPRHRVVAVREVTAEPCRMRKQVLYLDLLCRVLVREVGYELCERIVERHLSLLDKLGDRNGGEHLVHRAEIEFCVDAILCIEVLIRDPEGSLVKHLTVVCQQYRSREHIGVGQLFRERFQLTRDLFVAKLSRVSCRGFGCSAADASHLVRRSGIDDHAQRLPVSGQLGFHQ